MTLTPMIVLWVVFTWPDGNAWQPLAWYWSMEGCQLAKLNLDLETTAWTRGECRALEDTNRVDTDDSSDVQ